MSNITQRIIRIVFLSILLSCAQLTMAESSIDYNSVDISSLQSQYQNQLKPKVSKRTPKKPVKRRHIQNKQLLQYQQLLANQQQQSRVKAQRQRINRPAQQVHRKVRANPQARSIPAPRRDAIFEAASSGNVRLIGQLISQGANVNQANNERETPLHMAAAKGHYSAVIYLLNNGANIHARTINNWLAIHHATRFRHAQIANYLKQKGSPIYARTSDGLSAIDMARAVNDRRILGIFGVR